MAEWFVDELPLWLSLPIKIFIVVWSLLIIYNIIIYHILRYPPPQYKQNKKKKSKHPKGPLIVFLNVFIFGILSLSILHFL